MSWFFVHCVLNKGLSYQSELHTSSTCFKIIQTRCYQSASEPFNSFFSIFCKNKSTDRDFRWASTCGTKTSLPHNPDASSASANKVSSCLRTAEPWGRGIKKHVKSMRVFLFPDLVFPCSLILPLSGVSAQVSSLLIGQDWDGRNSWSALTHRPMIFFIFFIVTVQTEKQTWLFLSWLADTDSGV